jgi:hypothetical protein
MTTSLSICTRCVHCKRYVKSELFNKSDLQMSGPAGAKIKGFEEEEQLRTKEMLQFQAGERFTYEPHNYDWCAIFTPLDAMLPDSILQKLADNDLDGARKLAHESHNLMIELLKRAKSDDSEALQELMSRGGGTLNPVSGNVEQVYALCYTMNHRAQCPLFEPFSKITHN